MAKRVSLSERRERDAVKGVDLIFGDTSAEAKPQERTSESSSPSQDTEAASKVQLSKVTLYIRPDQVIEIEKIQLEQRQKTGKKPDKSDLVQEALDLLVEKYRNS